MPNLYIRLVAESFDYVKRQTVFLFTNTKPYMLPRHQNKSDEEIQETVRRIIKDYLDVDPNWVKTSLLNFEKIGSAYFATYATVIPYDVKLKYGIRLSYMDINNNKDIIPERDIIVGKPQ